MGVYTGATVDRLDNHRWLRLAKRILDGGPRVTTEKQEKYLAAYGGQREQTEAEFQEKEKLNTLIPMAATAPRLPERQKVLVAKLFSPIQVATMQGLINTEPWDKCIEVKRGVLYIYQWVWEK